MSEKIKTILSVLIILIVLPYIITYALQGKRLLEQKENHIAQNNETEEEIKRLTGILAGQIEMDAPKEAILAQAVLVRTEDERRKNVDETEEKSLSLEEMEILWGSDRLQENYETARAAVEETSGEILTYDSNPIIPSFHKVSAGATREIESMNGEETPYLDSVACGMDITSPDYLTIRFFSKKEFLEGLNLEKEANPTSFSVETDEAGYVKKMMFGDKEFSGDEVRQLLGLPSPCFYIKEIENQMRIVVKGKGHGIGMSQFAACKMAEKGDSYKEILDYFFPNTKLQQKENENN